MLAENSPSEARPLRVAIVDDDLSVLRLTQFRLEGAGMACRTYRKGREAFAAVENDPCDVLLIDARLEADADEWRDGVALYEKLAAAGCAAPAILISGAVDRPLIARAARAGFWTVVDKSHEHSRRLAEAVWAAFESKPSLEPKQDCSE